MLDFNEVFADCDFSNLTSDSFEAKVIDNLNMPDRNWTWANGISKGVIIPKEGNYVFKIPFVGEYNQERYDELCTDDDEVPEEDVIDYNANGKNDENFWDYCRREENFYNAAEAAGVRHAFLKTYRLGFVNNYPIYCQEKGETFEDHLGYVGPDSPMRHTPSAQKAQKYSEEHHTSRYNIAFQGMLIDAYGETFYDKLAQFLNDNYLDGDLHDENIGFDMGGDPVLMDYSGYDN